MEQKAPSYNGKIPRSHDRKGIHLKITSLFSGDEVWNGPIRKEATLEILSDQINPSDELVTFYRDSKEIPKEYLKLPLTKLREEILENEAENVQEVLEFQFARQKGTDCGLLQAASKGEAQSLEAALEDLKKKTLPQDMKTLHQWCTKALLIATKRMHYGQVQLLVEAKADVEVSLLLAVNQEKKEMVKFLLDLRANIEAKDPEGNTALLLAARKGYEGIVTLLLSEKANVAATNQDGNTALMFLASAGSTEVISQLVKSGASVNDANHDGFTSLHIAVKEGCDDTVKLLLEERDEDTPLLLAAREWQKDRVELLVEKRANVNAANRDGMTPLICLASFGDVALVKLLVENGANTKGTWQGYTALQHAAREGHAETAQILKEILDQKKDILEQELQKLSHENLWERRKLARQKKDIEGDINGAIYVANKNRNRQVSKVLKAQGTKEQRFPRLKAWRGARSCVLREWFCIAMEPVQLAPQRTVVRLQIRKLKAVKTIRCRRCHVKICQVRGWFSFTFRPSLVEAFDLDTHA